MKRFLEKFGFQFPYKIIEYSKLDLIETLKRLLKFDVSFTLKTIYYTHSDIHYIIKTEPISTRLIEKILNDPFHS